MGKNHQKFEYYDVAVPRTNTILLGYLQEMHDNTNTPQSQLLVQLATERVKQLYGDGQPTSLTALGPLQAAMASLLTALPPAQGPQAPMNGATPLEPPVRPPGIQSLTYNLMQLGAGDVDMDAYGDPDE